MLSLLAAAALVTPAPPRCRNLSFSRSLALARTSQAVCVERQRDLNVWSLRRTEKARDGSEKATYTNTSACPAILPVLQAVEALELPKPDLLGFGREVEFITMDGAGYMLTSSGLYGGAVSDLTIESNVDTPLAKWIDTALVTLQPCWRSDD